MSTHAIRLHRVLRTGECVRAIEGFGRPGRSFGRRDKFCPMTAGIGGCVVMERAWVFC
jgi:hypothetical protein